LPGGCEQAIKEQLTEIDAVELSVVSVALGGTPTARTATARVKSIYSGKKKTSTMSLVKESGKWKISSFS
jgi:copper chaperone CopZ